MRSRSMLVRHRRGTGRQYGKLSKKTTTTMMMMRSRSAVQPRASLQLASALLPRGIDQKKFCAELFQWATTLTTSGYNYPFVRSLRVLRADNGFLISLMDVIRKSKRGEVELEPFGTIDASIESVVKDNEERIALIVRFDAGPAADGRSDKEAMEMSPDVPVIMSGMRDAIVKAARSS